MVGALLALGLLGAEGAAAAKPSHGPLIVSPRPGLSVKGDSVRVVVKAGPEHEDLKAKLNGVAIGGPDRALGALASPCSGCPGTLASLRHGPCARMGR